MAAFQEWQRGTEGQYRAYTFLSNMERRDLGVIVSFAP